MLAATLSHIDTGERKIYQKVMTEELYYWNGSFLVQEAVGLRRAKCSNNAAVSNFIKQVIQ